MNRKNRIVHIFPKSSSACYVIRCMYHLSNKETNENNLLFIILISVLCGYYDMIACQSQIIIYYRFHI
jgi:hypothetical protein